MKGLKKKILIALLAATCITAGAIGLSACGGNKNANDSALYAIYLAETDNGTTQTYQQWLESKLSTPSDGQTPYIGENGNWWIGATDTGVKAGGTDGSNGTDGRGIESVKTIGGEFVVFYTDGTYELIEEADDVPFKMLKVKALDQVNAPVAKAYLQLYSYDSENYVSTPIGTAVSNSDGFANFIYIPEDGVTYRVGLADHGKTEYDPALPEGYNIKFPVDEKFGWTLKYFTVEPSDNKVQTLNIPFEDTSHSFTDANLHNKIKKIPYTRTYSETAEGNAVESNGTENNAFTVDVKAGYHTYISFISYVNPATSSDKEETQKLLDNATKAATGTYKFSIFGGSNPVLYFYEGNSGNMPADERGIPRFIISHTGTASGTGDDVATGTNYITVNNDSTVVRGEIFFGLYSDSDCTVTLTVERTGDAQEIPSPKLIAMPAPTNLTKWTEKSAVETLTLMPVSGTYTAVKGSDGYYHVNSEHGPILVAMLTKPVARYLTEISLQEYPTSPKNERQETVLHFNPTDIDEYFNHDKRYPLKKYDYNAILTEYCKFVNRDGVYGVDDTLYALLTNLASTGTGIDYSSAAAGCQWLLPCYYYSPEGGLSVPGSGTEADPYLISTGENKIAMTGLEGTAQLKLNVPSAGVYVFETSGNLSITGYTTSADGKKLYVLIPEAGDVTLTISGIAASYRLTISEGKSISAFLGGGSEGDEPSKGIDADTAISVIGTGVWSVLDNKEVNDGVYIDFACDMGGTGRYVLTVYGGGTLTYGSTTATSVTINAKYDLGDEFAETYGVYIKASETANLMLVITKLP